MVVAVVILVFLVLGLAFACANLYGYWKKADKDRNEAQRLQKEWEAFGLSTKEENDALAKYRPIVDVDAHISQIKSEAEARLAAISAEVSHKEEVLKEAENKAIAEAQEKIKQIELAAQAKIQQTELEAQARTNAAREELAGEEREVKNRIRTTSAILAEKEEQLKQTKDLLTATRNIVEGYGNEYLVPKDSIFDQIAEAYGYEKAGKELKEAREVVRRMIRKGLAASSGLTDKAQNEAAKDFLVDAFNGRVDAVFEKIKKEGYGVLRQQIKDIYAVVNESGRHFANTQITKEYLDARIYEMRWAIKVQEIIDEEKEEQKRLKEIARDEALARREAEKAQKEIERQAQEQKKKEQEAEKERERQREILSQARKKAEELAKELVEKEKEKISEEEKAKLLETINYWKQKTSEAEEKAKDADEIKTEAERRVAELEEKYRRSPLDPRGKIYIISNVGSFGDHVYKVGFTRREAEERVKDLGDASVPFEFDIHAVIKAENAPELETKLHRKLSMYRLNKSNWRKEFFKITIEELKRLIEEEGHETSWTMKAKARQYMETKEIEKRIQEDGDFREQWLSQQTKLDLWAERKQVVPLEDE
jgi:hypothetical protein